jgi:hypothetical protein
LSFRKLFVEEGEIIMWLMISGQIPGGGRPINLDVSRGIRAKRQDSDRLGIYIEFDGNADQDVLIDSFILRENEDQEKFRVYYDARINEIMRAIESGKTIHRLTDR